MSGGRVDGHELVGDGLTPLLDMRNRSLLAPRRFIGRGGGAVCLCGARSGELTLNIERKWWHRKHLAEVAAADATVSDMPIIRDGPAAQDSTPARPDVQDQEAMERHLHVCPYQHEVIERWPDGIIRVVCLKWDTAEADDGKEVTEPFTWNDDDLVRLPLLGDPKGDGRR